MLQNWTHEFSRNFRKKVFTFEHSIKETNLFSDEALIALIAKHPAHLTDVCTVGKMQDTKYPGKLLTGDFRDLSPEQIFTAAKNGSIWINLRRAMNVHAEYKEVLDQMYGGIAQKTGKKAFNANGGILITSPVARTPYHFDKTETILWHIRGPKRIFFYPVTPKFIPDKAYETAVLDMVEDDLPYDASFDKEAKVIDLKEGEAVTWPLSSPHRVENMGFCVSVTTEFSSKESALKNAAMTGNATIRQMGLNPSWTGASPISRALQSSFGLVLKKTGMAKKIEKHDYVKFKLCLEAPGNVVEVDPYIRNF